MDDNKIKIINKADTTVKMKLSVLALEPYENLTWYKIVQGAARVAMSVRNISVSYRNQYSMALPGFTPMIGSSFGQNRHDGLAPGLGFAFGFIDDSFINKAQDRGWLVSNDSINPATTNATSDLQVKMTLEPFNNFKIDLNMAHSQTRQKSVQYVYAGNPTTQSGTFSMTTVSIKSAFEGIGDANSGYRSASFENFCNLLDTYKARVQNQFAGSRYPSGSSRAGQSFNPENGEVNRYSADVMVPAFLNAYTGYSGLSIFPAITSMLPNWSLRFSGLTQIQWFKDHFKSFNINHSYKSIYTVGSYSSFSTYMAYMGDQIGFITDATDANKLIPNSMFNVSTVSINESFSPLIGIDFTLPNNMTFKVEYKTTRVLTLSMTSVQINEAISKDWVIGMGYKINDFKLFNRRSPLTVKGKKKGAAAEEENNKKSSTTSKSKGFAHDLNMRLDMSYRSQAAITRDIASMSSSATSGNSAFKLAFSAEYTLSKLLSMTFYYDRQTNTPLLSSGSYPTVTQDFGLGMKFSLTR